MTVEVILKAEVETIIEVDIDDPFAESDPIKMFNDAEQMLEDAIAEEEEQFYRHITQDYNGYCVEGEVRAAEYDAYKDERDRRSAILNKAYEMLDTTDKLTRDELSLLYKALAAAAQR